MRKVKQKDKLFFNNSDFQMIEHEEEFIFTSRKRFKWFKTSRTGYDILMNLDSKNTIKEVIQKISSDYELDYKIIENDIINFCSHLLTEKLVEMNVKNIVEEINTTLRTVYIDVTNVCNLKCYYCNKTTERNEKNTSFMSMTNYKNILDTIVSKTSDNLPILYITGGEPLLHPNIIEMLHYAHFKGFKIFLWTNGTVVTEENIDRLKEYCNSIIVSIDGSNSLINDAIRGSGTFDKIIETCKILQDNKVPFLLSSTPNKKNTDDLTKIYSLAYNLGARGFFLNEPIFMKEDGKDISEFFIKDISLFNKVDEALAKQSILIKSWKNNQLKQHNSNEDVTIYFKDIQKCFNNPIRLDKKKSCGACLNEISINVEGIVHPCHNLHFNKFKLGDIVSYYNIRNEYEKNELRTLEECKECFYWIFCLGGCKARALFYNENINSKSPDCNKLKQEYYNFLISPLQPKSEEI